jgi:hypothetical protein
MGDRAQLRGDVATTETVETTESALEKNLALFSRYFESTGLRASYCPRVLGFTCLSFNF